MVRNAAQESRMIYEYSKTGWIPLGFIEEFREMAFFHPEEASL